MVGVFRCRDVVCTQHCAKALTHDPVTGGGGHGGGEDVTGTWPGEAQRVVWKAGSRKTPGAKIGRCSIHPTPGLRWQGAQWPPGPGPGHSQGIWATGWGRGTVSAQGVQRGLAQGWGWGGGGG
jgi:hypothetical protein